jgi:hypothetical protein
MNPTLHATQRLTDVLKLTNGFSNRALFVQKNCVKSDFGIPTFPVSNLWSIWGNTVLFSTFSDYVFVDKLRTRHKKVFIVYDINWHIDSISMDYTLSAINKSDLVFAKSVYDIGVINQFTDREILLLNNFSDSETIKYFEGKINELQ